MITKLLKYLEKKIVFTHAKYIKNICTNYIDKDCRGCSFFLLNDDNCNIWSNPYTWEL